MIKVPKSTLCELEKKSPEAHQMIMDALYESAIELYKTNPEARKNGLEACQEALIKLLNNGIIKLTIISETNEVILQTYDAKLGEYK